MKIIELEQRGPPAIGGVEKTVFELSKIFKKSKYEIEIWSSDLLDWSGKKDKKLNRLIENIKIVKFKSYNTRLPFIKIIYPSLIFKLLKIKDKKNVILHTRSILFHTIVALLFAKLFKKVIMTLHLDSTTPPNKLIMFSLKLLCNQKNIFITTDTHNEKRIYLKYGFNSKKIYVIPNGVNLKEFDKITQTNIDHIKKEYDLNNSLNLIYLGRIAKIKGCDLLIKAYAHIISKQNIKLIFAGPDFGSMQELKKMVKKLNLENNVLFTGSLKRNKLCEVLKSCDILIHPSKGGESFGIVLAEAMACGKPIIASKTGGFSEVLNNGENGLLFNVGNYKDLANKINQLIKDNVLYLRLREQGRKRVERTYGWDIIVHQFIEIIEK